MIGGMYEMELLLGMSLFTAMILFVAGFTYSIDKKGDEGINDRKVGGNIDSNIFDH